MSRNRLSWTDGDKLPVEQARAASAHPATPDEGAAHPAHQPDPEAHDYENGDTSSWAEDPTKGPYPNSAHPATPDEGAGHPAHKQTETSPNSPGDQVTNDDLGVSKAAAMELRAAVERKASVCVRIAAYMLSNTSNEKTLEKQALAFMDIPDSRIQETLDRMAADEDDDADDDDDDGKEAAKQADSDDALLRRLLAEEEDDDEADAEGGKKAEDDDDDDEDGKEASADKSATEQILAAITGIGERLSALENPVASTEPVASDDEALLQAMLAEEEDGMDAPEDVEAMLHSMVEEEATYSNDEVDEEAHMDVDPVELNVDMGGGDLVDPMGMLDEDILDEEDDALLANLFADTRLAADDEEEEEDDDSDDDSEEEEEEEESDAEAKAKKKAAQRKSASRKPRPKKASKGARRLGGVTKSAANEIKELEALWPTAPDVRDVFGT